MMHELTPPHASMAAAELLRDLLAIPSLAPYVLPRVWREMGQHEAIASLAASARCCVAVGLGEDRLPDAGQRKQGGLLHLGLAVYVFLPAEGQTALQPHHELRERIWLTLIRYVSCWGYTLPGGEQSKAVLSSTAEVDLAGVNPSFAGKVSASALLLEVPIRLA